MTKGWNGEREVQCIHATGCSEVIDGFCEGMHIACVAYTPRKEDANDRTDK